AQAWTRTLRKPAIPSSRLASSLSNQPCSARIAKTSRANRGSRYPEAEIICEPMSKHDSMASCSVRSTKRLRTLLSLNSFRLVCCTLSKSLMYSSSSFKRERRTSGSTTAVSAFPQPLQACLYVPGIVRKKTEVLAAHRFLERDSLRRVVALHNDLVPENVVIKDR